MPLSLYDVTVPGFLQGLDAAIAFLEKGRKHLADQGIDLESVVDTRVYPDMLPFRFQIHSVIHHSRGALDGVMAGLFQPPPQQPAHTYAELQALVAQARDAVAAVTPEALNAREGAEVIFELRGNKLPFTAQDFLLSFSIPNFHFHATTAYGILRAKGVPVGKRDYLGAMRMKKPA